MTPPRRNRLGFIAFAFVVVAAWLAWWLVSADSSIDRPSERNAPANGLARSELGAATKTISVVGDRSSAAIEGRVIDGSGAPIADARVCASGSERDITATEEPFPRCAVSGPGGIFVLEGLFAVVYRLSASARSFQPASFRWRDGNDQLREGVMLAEGERREGVDIVLRAGGVQVVGVVHDISGGTIEGALVRGTSRWGDGAAASAISDGDGKFELWVAPGVGRFDAVADGYAPSFRQAVAPGQFVELFLMPESVIHGRVVRAGTDEPVDGATVKPDAFGRFTARSDAEGRFRIGALEPGRYKPVAFDEESYGVASQSLQLGLGETSEEVVIELHPAFTVRGRIVVAAKDERPCVAGSIDLSDVAQALDHRGATDPSGEIRIEGIQPGNYTVLVRCDGYLAEDAYENIVIADASAVDLEWRVREGLAIRGRVVDGDGVGVAKMRVWAAEKRKVDDPRGQRATSGGESEEDGSFELGGLLPGDYEVHVSSAERPAPDQPAQVQLESGADVNDLVIELPSTGALRGDVVDERGEPVAGAAVQVTSSRWGGSSTMCADDGTFALASVKVGSHRVVAKTGDRYDDMRAPGTSDDDVQGQRVEIVAGETVAVRLVVESHGGVIRGRVIDEEGQPVRDAYVDAQRETDSATAGSSRNRRAVRWGGWNRQPHLSDDLGEFEIADLVSDATYTVRAYFPGGGEALAESVAVGSVVELALLPTGELSGTVRLAGGGVPQQFQIMVEDRLTGYRNSERYFRTQGQWRMAELPAGEFEIGLQAPEGAADAKVSLGGGERVGGVELVVQPKITVRGTIIDLETSEPLPGFKVHVAPANNLMIRGDSGGAQHKEVSDAQGRFEVANAPTGRVTILVLARGFVDDLYDTAWQVRTLAAAPAVQEMGTFALVKRRIERGEKAGDLGYQTKEAGPDADPQQVRHIVALVRPGGPAEAGGLVVGDEIVRVDGHEVIGANASRLRGLTRVAPGTKLVLGLADGKDVTIIAGPSLD